MRTQQDWKWVHVLMCLKQNLNANFRYPRNPNKLWEKLATQSLCLWLIHLACLTTSTDKHLELEWQKWKFWVSATLLAKQTWQQYPLVGVVRTPTLPNWIFLKVVGTLLFLKLPGNTSKVEQLSTKSAGKAQTSETAHFLIFHITYFSLMIYFLSMWNRCHSYSP